MVRRQGTRTAVASKSEGRSKRDLVSIVNYANIVVSKKGKRFTFNRILKVMKRRSVPVVVLSKKI